MVENQHQKIKGYRDLSELEIGMMNDCKLLAIQVGELVDKIGRENTDPRWVSIARTDLQKGFMALVRAVAQPSTF